MNTLVECVANFSEGTRTNVIDSIVSSINNVDGVMLLGAESDRDHNRSVLSFAGAPDKVAEAAFASIRQAAQLIDMERHRGLHPRIGAADVLPFIPIRDATMADCVKLARSLGKRVGAELQLPVFLYGQAALQEYNRELPDIRRGGYERLRSAISTGLPPQPDFGPHKLGRAGGCIIGARNTLIAFNVYLTTSDLTIAREIARLIRQSSGGLPHVRALGLLVKGKAQVSMNLLNYKITSLRQVVEAIRYHAQRFDVDIECSEIVGLIPQDALSAADVQDLQVINYSPKRILEVQLADML